MSILELMAFAGYTITVFAFGLSIGKSISNNAK